ncbi:hypothetical protein LC087_15880 [Bacillus carboniphilus]|uniref:Lipoprotein n=1 Tax=Bacillus carboniphilus TaxID=86663 RepID=A0ABY9JS14_9BACI|nr:hypothetical protein [Bacillus carboniphilus]WLR42201.1 hypothetical protein LC087_15880 [Bacillus carboniphilus]
MKKILLLAIFLLLAGCDLEPNIIIEGVEDEKVYASQQIIKLDKEAAGKYQMVLNGEQIESGHQVSKNSDYELTI